MLDNVTATLVPDEQRQNFLPGLFGLNRLIISENMVYAFMEQLSPLDYSGGYWTFHELEGKPLFLAPTSKPRYRITWEGNGYAGEVSAEAAGIIATMFALSHLSFRFEDDRFGGAFCCFRLPAQRQREVGEGWAGRRERSPVRVPTFRR